MKKVFCASLATETNTFSPIFTQLQDFYDSFYAPPGKHPPTPTLCSAPLVACRERAGSSWELVEGTCTWAEPGGLVSRRAYEGLRDEILEQLAAAMPVDAAVFGLHGAMVAEGYQDCEGDLLARARAVVGAQALLVASFDPHSHLTPAVIDAIDFMTAFKEFPHTDFLETGEALVALLDRTLRGEVKPVLSVFDCRMVDIMPTTAEPMRAYVDRLKALERDDPRVLSTSVIHGFMAGDVADLGSKAVVVTDGERAFGDELARQLGMELFGMRGQTRDEYLSCDEAFAQARASMGNGKPVVFAEVWDNPGGGVAGDSTVLLKEILRRGIESAAIGSIWDPMAVRHCFAAGEGAVIPLRFGAKSGPNTGEPADARVLVMKLDEHATQRFGPSMVPLGPAAMVRVLRDGDAHADGKGVDVVLNTVRSQTFGTTLFSGMGIVPEDKDLLVVKSTNHFHASFATIADAIYYVDTGTPYPSDPCTTGYRNLVRAIWPIVDDPHGPGQA